MVTDISFRQFDAHCEDATGMESVMNVRCASLAGIDLHRENDPSDLDGYSVGVEIGLAPPIARVEDTSAMGTHQNAKNRCPYGFTDVYLSKKGSIATSIGRQSV